MPHPQTPATARPVLDDPGSAVALVTTVPVDGPGRPRAVAEAVARLGADPDAWPRGLASFTVYVDETAPHLRSLALPLPLPSRRPPGGSPCRTRRPPPP
ncbi:hypothetical protein ACFW57_33185, partial [Streptomyces sp. NPDC058757]